MKYPVDRPLTDQEKQDALSRDAADDPSFDERGGLVAMNSTYMEWVDRRFRARGSGSTFLAVLVMLLMFVAIVAFAWTGWESRNVDGMILVSSAGCIAFAISGYVFYWLQVSIDFFRKVYYPIRFNRKNRMIYVYRDERDGGILRVPWDDVHFHIGRGVMNPSFVDIRGEVMSGDMVKDTFAVGSYFPGNFTNGVQESWAFICRYMDGGPEAVGPDPDDRYIGLSLNGTWKDCLVMAYINYPPNVNVLTFIIGWPTILCSTLTRWLVFKSCSWPEWTEDIESECKVDSRDANIWPQPKYMNQFVNEIRSVCDRANARRRANLYRARKAAGQSDLGSEMAKWDAAMKSRRQL